MTIIADSRRVLQGIYDLLDDNSYCLVVEIPYKEFTEKYEMTRQHLNLCIHYLIETGYIKGSYCFNNSENEIKEVTVLPPTIMLEENTRF